MEEAAAVRRLTDEAEAERAAVRVAPCERAADCRQGARRPHDRQCMLVAAGDSL